MLISRTHMVVIYLLKSSLTIHFFEGNTALMYACQTKETSRVQLLLDEGKANPNHQNKEGKTALFETSGAEVVSKLLERGADPNLKGMYLLI
jgi:ankyrin repeat protein